MTTAVRFCDLHRGALENTLDGAPDFERFAPAAKRAIRTIHSLTSLFRGRSLDEIELYVGRTSCDPSALRGRWRCHESNRAHCYGVVLVVCPTDRVRMWERAVKRLEKRRALCVANVSAGGQGPLPASKYSCVYLTWRFKESRRCCPVDAAQLERLASEVHVKGPNEPTLDSWRRAIAPLPTPNDRIHLRWARPERRR